MSPAPIAKVRCRQIVDDDINNAADLLTRGFPVRSRQYWLTALARLKNHPTPAGSPKYGYVLESNGVLVGIVLLITSSIQTGGTSTIRCNISSWFVDPAYRANSTFLISRALSRPDVTYVNISPAQNTLRTIEAQGFSRYSSGQFVALPGFYPSAGETKIIEVGKLPDAPLECFERDLLLSHSSYGCLSLCCMTTKGSYPFVFLPRTLKGVVPCVQLVYCRNVEDYVRLARPLGWYLASRGMPFVIIDSNGPVQGLWGKYSEDKMPKYFRGPTRPRLGDLAYTEAPMFGV